jgi:hypothetical protein
MKILLLAISILFTLNVLAQTIQTDSVTTLSSVIKETSGLIVLNDRLITINDSGNQPILYEIDTLTGQVARQVVIANALNIDWESICFDDDNIYIADIGNNLGTRQNLKVYKVNINDYFNTMNDTVYADSILFNYANQTAFTPQQYTTNFDAEAIVNYNDSLYIFTKNWGNSKTNIYVLPKTTGNYALTIRDSINTLGIITDAEYNSQQNELILIGHNINTPFIVRVTDFNSTSFSSGTINKNFLSVTGSFQIESICLVDNFTYYISSEKYSNLSSTLSRFSSSDFVNSTEIKKALNINLYPNPTTGLITLTQQKGTILKIINLQGQMVYQTQIQNNNQTINLHFLTKGIYIYQLNNHVGQIIIE